MRTGIMSTAMESIGFQDGKLHAKLTQAVEEVRGLSATLKDEEFFGSKEMLSLLSLLKRNTGIYFIVSNGEGTGPAVMCPAMDVNHPFISEEVKSAVREGYFGVDGFADAKRLMDFMQKKLIKGEVDMKNSRVSGAFERLMIRLFLPRSMFKKNGIFTNAEISAIILHEVGHAYTYMEFISRTVTTNQVLAGMVRAADKTMGNTREVIFARGSELLKMNKQQVDALHNAKDSREVSVIVLDTAVQRTISELGASCYDVTSCEYLADQFAARHGAARDLVTAMDKFYQNDGWRQRTPGNFLVSAVQAVLFILGLVWLTAVTLGSLWLVLIFAGLSTNHKKHEIYDNEKSRFLRIKHQNIERLKDRDVEMEEKKALVEANEVIDKVASFYDDNLSLIEKACYYINPYFRNAHKYEMLQKDLERLASSDLFTHAAKLSTI